MHTQNIDDSKRSLLHIRSLHSTAFSASLIFSSALTIQFSCQSNFIHTTFLEKSATKMPSTKYLRNNQIRIVGAVNRKVPYLAIFFMGDERNKASAVLIHIHIVSPMSDARVLFQIPTTTLRFSVHLLEWCTHHLYYCYYYAYRLLIAFASLIT